MPILREIIQRLWVCQHCGHEWLPRTDYDPVKCPKCQRLRP